jgi:hypothetical protein
MTATDIPVRCDRAPITIATNHTIFERTPEIQQLVIARAISGMRVE